MPGNEGSSRLTASEILDEVIQNARKELGRSTRALAFSGVAGGIGMGLTGLGVASAMAVLGEGKMQDFIALLLYPLGFVSVIIGRAQLFTENTLYPVALVLTERRHIRNTIRLWITVFVFNVIGAAVFATLAVKTGSLQPEVADSLVRLGTRAIAGQSAYVFWSGVIGGWIIALMAWIVSASQWTIGQLAVVYLLTLVVGIGHFSHCIASSGEILSAVLSGHGTFLQYFRWLGAATAGNILGGVFFVTLLNFGQVHAE